MSLPTWGQIQTVESGLNKLEAMAHTANTLADALADGPGNYATKIRDAIDNLEWSGAAKNAADGRADREKRDLAAVATAYRNLGTAATGACRDLGADVHAIYSALANAGTGFTVSAEDPNWTISGTPANSTAQDLHDELVRLAQGFDSHQQQYASVITDASNDLQRLAPAASALSAAQADRDMRDLRNGHAAPDAIIRLQAATHLTDQQKQDLANGRSITVSPSQYDYLQEVMRSLDSTNISELPKFGSGLPSQQQKLWQSAVADGMQLMANPDVHVAGCPDTGGMRQLPAQVQKLLTENPLTHGETQTPTFEPFTRASPYLSIRASDFRDLTGLLAHGDNSLANGSDIDRALLKQSAEIAAAASNPHNEFSFDGPPRYSSDYHAPNREELGKLLDGMLTTAGGDHTAAHDFITGDRMNVTCNEGGTYNARDHVMDMLTHPWSKDQHGASELFRWIGEDAGSTDADANRRAGDTANHLADLLSANSDTLAKNMPNQEGHSLSLGKVNPELTQTLANTMSPYLGNFVGAGHPDHALVDNHTGNRLDINPVANVQKLGNMFNVLDSDPAAAATINNSGAAWANYLSFHAGAHPDNPSLGTDVGTLNKAMKDGLVAQLQDLKAANDWETLRHYNMKAVTTDTISGVAGMVPFLGPAVATADPWIKEFGFSLPSDPTARDYTDQWTKALAALADPHNPSTTNVVRYNWAAGYVSAHPEATSLFNYTDENGNTRSFFKANGDPVNIDTLFKYFQYFENDFAKLPGSVRHDFDGNYIAAATGSFD